MAHRALTGAVFALAALTGGCSALLPAPQPPPAFYLIDGRSGAPPPAPASSQVARSTPLPAAASGLTLVVEAPRAAAGFDSQAMLYQRQPHQLERFARSQWIATPQRMLAPLIAPAMVDGGTLRAAVSSADAGRGELRLDTQILGLVQDFGSRPSRVRFTLRATLLEDATRRVIAVHDFETEAPAPTDDPEGGVSATNQAVHAALVALADWCNRSAAAWHPASAVRPAAKP